LLGGKIAIILSDEQIMVQI